MTLISNYLGRLDYNQSLTLQGELLQKAQDLTAHFVIGLEHPAVVTLGYRANAELEVLPENKLKVEKTARGGFATLHSEGQLVIYPVVNLRRLNIGVRDFICILLETTKKLLEKHGVAGFINDEALGLYTAKGKIAFCGIHVSRGVTQHGISINISNDLNLFRNIRSCGIQNAKFDRLADHSEHTDLAALYQEWVILFKERLGI